MKNLRPPVRIRLKSPLLPILVGVLFVIQILDPYDGWLALLVGLGGAWLFSYLWVRSLGRHLHLTREMRFGWAQVGDRLEERFTLTNTGIVPGLWVEVRDQTNMPGYQVSRATGVGPAARNRWITEAECSRRGLFTLGPTLLRSGDPLGIYTVEITHPNRANLLVTPPIVPLPEIEIAPGGRAGEGRPRPDAPERTVSVSGVRQYLAGDSLRWVHWPTTARKDELYVRLFEGTPAGDWWVILDVDRSVQVGKGQDSTEEHGVILAASLADRALRQRRAVGLAVNGGELIWLPPREGDGQRWEVLRSLALVTPGERPLGELLERMRPSFGRRSSLILITADTRGDWVEALLPLLWNGAVPTVLLLDPVTFGGRGDVHRPARLLAGLGVAHSVIPRELLDRPEARPGQKGRWDWRVSPGGRAVAVNRPQDLGWKVLS